MILALLAIASVAAVGYSAYKHYTLAQVVAAVKAEVVVLEGKVAASGVEAVVKADLAAAVAKLKALL